MDELKVKKFADAVERDKRTVIRWKKRGIIYEYSEAEVKRIKSLKDLLFTKKGCIKRVDKLPKGYFRVPKMTTLTKQKWEKFKELLEGGREVPVSENNKEF